MRRAGVIYVGVSLPVVALISAFAEGQAQYIVAFVVLGSGLYTTPAIALAATAIHRLAKEERWRATIWLLGLVLVYTSGVAMLVGVVTGWRFANRAGIVVVVLTTVAFMGTAVALVRSLSGRRALSVDLIEWLMSSLVLTAPAVLLWGDAVVSAEDVWFTVPAGIATLATASGGYWVTVLYLRQGPDRPFEASTARIGMALVLLGLTDAIGQTAHGISDFSLPSWPLITVHATCMSLLLMIPLYLPGRHSTGLDRLPPQAQVRGVGLVGLVTLAGLPILGLVTLAQRDQHRWASGFAFGVVVGLVVLATLRQLAGVRETRRLYSLVEKVSADRRDLLAHMIQRIDDDRHAVAAQLHEQAISAYATFVSFVQATAPSRGGIGQRGLVDDASALVRDDLARQAESLRQLMLAVRPMGADRPNTESIGTLVKAYLDSLYGDRRGPELDVVVDPRLALDWITQTTVLRIVQEALHNVWRHSEATQVQVVLRAEADGAQVLVSDDGVGFDPEALLFESGIDAMRSFAASANGRLAIESAPGTGTVVVADLGDSRSPTAQEPATPILRPV